MEIKGWVGERDYQEIQEQRYNRYKELKDKKAISIESVRTGYAQKTYTGAVNDPNISELDVLILCDDGNTCFGGRVTMSAKRFTATVYTD